MQAAVRLAVSNAGRRTGLAAHQLAGGRQPPLGWKRDTANFAPGRGGRVRQRAGRRVATPWGSADSAALTWNAAADEHSPSAGDAWGFLAKINRYALDGRAVGVATPWGSADSVALTGNGAAVEGFPAAGDAWGFWAKINRWALDWQGGPGQGRHSRNSNGRFLCAGSWRAPELVLTNLDAALYGGGLSGPPASDVASRELRPGELGF